MPRLFMFLLNIRHPMGHFNCRVFDWGRGEILRISNGNPFFLLDKPCYSTIVELKWGEMGQCGRNRHKKGRKRCFGDIPSL
jgi:hypothetical protein